MTVVPTTAVVITYTYDGLYRLTNATYSEAYTYTFDYAYDAVGNRTVMTDANAAVITYTYDLVNRLTRISYPDSSVTYAYDQVGNRTLMTDSLGTTRYTYDVLYRLTNVVDPYAQAITNTYDAVGNRTRLAYPDGKVVTYTFDAINRLITVTNWSNLATAYAYDKASRLITTTLPNGVRTVYTYDDANRLTRLTHTRNGGSETVGDYQFALDKVGNRLAVTETLLSPGGAGGVGPQLGALPTTADEVAASVTGHRAPGLSALALSTDTLSLAPAVGLARPAPFDAPGWPASRGVKTAQAGVAGQTGAAPASPGDAVYLPPPSLKPVEQASPGEALLLYTSRPSVTADGADAVLVGVVALDADRRPLPDGTPVAWTATLGSLTPISNGLANGVALARFVGGTAPGEATITVQIGAATSAASVSIVAAPADPDGEADVYDEAAELKELLAYLRTAIRRDAAGRLGVDAVTHGVAFEVGGIAFTPSDRRGRDGTANFTYQLAAVHAGSIVLPLGNLAAPTVTVQANTLAYGRGAGVVEWYTSRLDGLEQGFTLAALPPLDGDLVILGAFATRLRPELVSQREGILFREPTSGEAVLRYGSVRVTDSAGRRTAGQLELHGNQIAISIAQGWLAQAAYPVTVDPLLQNDLIFADGFESGDFSAWSAAVTDGGDLSVTAAAALVGTYGMQALIDDTTRIYARDDTPAGEARYRARFYFDPNSVTMTDNQDHDLLDGRTSSDSVFRVQLKFVNGGYQVRARIRTDAGSDLSTGDYPISDAPHFIEVDWAAATGAGANDGYLSLWIDGVLQETKSGIDNDTLRVEQARLGATGSMEAGIAGTEYFDAFESRRQTYIGPVDSGGSLLTTTIAYTYDPLYRLTGANYSGAYTYTFAYAYDKVGNRTAMTKTITSTLVTTYTYDAANRLATQNGQSSFTWDANGNLLNDGSTVYAYDFANRLISTTLSGVNTQFGYNGDGIRLRLIEAGALTTYTQDYAAPLPVVLQAKTGTASTQYVYSLGTRPLAEYEAAAWEHLLPDPLGSVRQIADSSGNVTLLKSYEPYGSVLNSQGTATSVFAYAGEQIDSTGLIYLRARYMQPRLGIFLSRDAWEGDALQPLATNGWRYADDNPVNRVDPSGNCTGCTINSLAKVVTGGARFRSGPGTNYPIKLYLPQNTLVTIWSDAIPDQRGEYYWRWTKLFTMGATGFIADHLLEPAFPPSPQRGGGSTPSLDFGFNFTRWPVAAPLWYGPFGPSTPPH